MRLLMLVGVCLACLGTSPRLGVEARRQKAGQDLGLLETQDQVSLLRKARQHLVRGVRAHLSAAADVCGCLRCSPADLSANQANLLSAIIF
jgi:hypothetical protein